jgi:hypothetical protein
MKKTNFQFLFVVLLITFISTSIAEGQDLKLTDRAVKDTTVMYKDGNYEGKSRA